MYSHIIPGEQNLATVEQCIANRQLAQTYALYDIVSVMFQPGENGGPDMFIATLIRDGSTVYSIFIFMDADPIQVVVSPEYTSLG